MWSRLQVCMDRYIETEREIHNAVDLQSTIYWSIDSYCGVSLSAGGIKTDVTVHFVD